MTYQQWLSRASELLSGGESPKRDAEILLSYVTGKNRTFLIAFGETELSADRLAQADRLLQRRARGEPIAYLVGEKEFWSLPLMVSPVTLIPRPDTERLVELALARLPATPADILDLGTGTGAIALAIASERPDCRIVGIDLQAEAVKLAEQNAQRLNIPNARFLEGNWFAPVNGERFDLIVSNPPYIDVDDPHLQQGDVRFEPKTALVSEEQGLADICYIVARGGGYLKPGGWLMVEHGWKQGEIIRKIFSSYGFRSIITEKDYGRNERVTLGYL